MTTATHPPNLVLCRGCKQLVDEAVCCCGSLLQDHFDLQHNYVPMGCDCHRARQEEVGYHSAWSQPINICLGDYPRIVKNVKDLVIPEPPTTDWDLE
jgi:hypothetical protein